MRTCGIGKDRCTLCCSLLPMSKKGNERAERLAPALIQAGMLPPNIQIAPDFDKPAGKRCPQCRHGKGCNIYLTRPIGCRLWFCRWLINDDMDDCARPDRAHYVVDVNPDYVKFNDQTIPVVQVWIDKDYPDAHRDPKLRAYMERRAKQDGFATLIRTNQESAMLIVPPSMAGDGQWHEEQSRMHEHEHTPEDKLRELGTIGITFQVAT